MMHDDKTRQIIINKWNGLKLPKFSGTSWLIDQLLEYMDHRISLDMLLKSFENHAQARKVKNTLAHKYNLPKFLQSIVNGKMSYMPGYFNIDDYNPNNSKLEFAKTPAEKTEQERKRVEKAKQEFISQWEPFLSKYNDAQLNNMLDEPDSKRPPKVKWLIKKILEEREGQKDD